jgi:hypothetical protein
VLDAGRRTPSASVSDGCSSNPGYWMGCDLYMVLIQVFGLIGGAVYMQKLSPLFLFESNYIFH